jgi:AraC family transcriptional regulator
LKGYTTIARAERPGGNALNYRHDIEKSIQYIEHNLLDPLTPECIAAEAGYSLFHFCRVFQIVTDFTVMEYVRKRRLSLAAFRISQGSKIIDVAMDFGYETASGFSKAFRKEFSLNPSQYVKKMSQLQGYIAGDILIQKTGGIMIQPIIINRPSIKIAGFGIKTNITNGTFTKDIAAFWSNYDTYHWEKRMYEALQPAKHGEVGIVLPESRQSGGLTYLLGVIVEDFDKVQPDMLTVEVPASTYAVFTTPPIDVTVGGYHGTANTVDFPNTIRQTWKYIFGVWFPQSGYVFDEEKSDFEFYDERCHFRPDTVMEIWIPIK